MIEATPVPIILTTDDTLSQRPQCGRLCYNQANAHVNFATMEPFDDYDYESILETLEPIYMQEGDAAAREILEENDFPPELIDQLMSILWQLRQRMQSSSYFDD